MRWLLIATVSTLVLCTEAQIRTERKRVYDWIDSELTTYDVSRENDDLSQRVVLSQARSFAVIKPGNIEMGLLGADIYGRIFVLYINVADKTSKIDSRDSLLDYGRSASPPPILSVAADQERLTIFYGLTTSYCILRIELEVTVAVVTKMKFRDLSGCSANRHLPTDCGATNITYFQGALLVSCEALGRVYRIGVTPSTPPYVSSLARYTNATIHGEFYPMIKGANGSANSKTGCLFAYQNFHWVNHDSHGGNFDEAKLRTNTLGPAYLDSRIVRGGISFTDVRADVRGSVWSRAIPQELNLGTSSIALTPFGPEIEGVIEQYLVRLEDFRHLVPREYLELYADGFFNFNVNDYLYIHSVTHSTFFRLDLDLSNFAKIKIIPLFDGKFMFVDKTARSKIYLLELKYLIPRLESWRLTPVEVSLRMSLPIEPIYTASIECENCSPRKSHTLKPAHGLTFRFEVTNGAQRDYGGRYCWYLKTEEGLRTRLLNEVFPSVSHSTMTRQFGNSSNVTLVLKYRTWNLLGRDTITAERKLLWPPYGTTTIPTTITPIPPLDVRNRDLRLAVLLAAVLTLALVLLLGCLVCQRGRKQRKKVALARMQREKEQQARGESIQQLMSMGAHQSSGALLMRPSQTMMMRAGPTAMNPAFVPLISLGSLAMMPKPQEEEVADTADEQMQNMLQMMEVNYGVMPQEREESRPVAKKQNYDDDDEEFVEEEVHKRGAMPREAYLLKGPSTGQPRMDESPESTPMRSSSTRKKPTTRKKAEKSSKAPKGRKVRDSVAESLVSEEDDDIVIPSGWSTAMAQGRAPAGTKGARVIY